MKERAMLAILLAYLAAWGLWLGWVFADGVSG